MQMTTGDEKQDICVQQMRTVQKIRQQKVKEEHHDRIDRSSTTRRRTSDYKEENKLKKKKKVIGSKKRKKSCHRSEKWQIVPYFKENHRKTIKNNYKKILF